MSTTGTSAPAAIVTVPAVVVSAITISNGMFSALANDSKFSNLSLAKDNWPKWKQKMMQVLGLSDLDDYILGAILAPDPVTDPTSSRNWIRNNNKTISFLQMHVDDSELQFLENVTDAAIAWTKLVDRHEKQGPVTQVRLIQEALSISY